MTDADNPGDGSITGPVAYHWQVEARPGTGIFEDIRAEVRGNEPARAEGATFMVTADLVGLSIRVRAVYQDANGVLEQVYSPRNRGGRRRRASAAHAGAGSAGRQRCVQRRCASDPHPTSQFILDQIKIAEQHAAGADLLDLIPNSRVAFGLRTVDGSFNNLVNIGNTIRPSSAPPTTLFPRLLDPFFRNDQDGEPSMRTVQARRRWSPTRISARAATWSMPIRASSPT